MSDRRKRILIAVPAIVVVAISQGFAWALLTPPYVSPAGSFLVGVVIGAVGITWVIATEAEITRVEKAIKTLRDTLRKIP